MFMRPLRTLRTNETRAKRLDTLLCNIIFCGIFFTVALCVVAFVATRTHMFHGALMRRQQSMLNNQWLVLQCKSPDFYSNMKQHSTLCDDVVLEQTDNLWLHALRDVIDQTYLCGDVPCINRIEQFIVWVFGRGLLLLAALAGSALLVFLLAVQIQRQLYGRSHDSYVQYAETSLQYPLLEDSATQGRMLRIRA
jgi:hypothetical protein